MMADVMTLNDTALFFMLTLSAAAGRFLLNCLCLPPVPEQEATDIWSDLANCFLDPERSLFRGVHKHAADAHLQHANIAKQPPFYTLNVNPSTVQLTKQSIH